MRIVKKEEKNGVVSDLTGGFEARNAQSRV